MSERVAAWVESAYINVAVAAEVGKVLADIVDKAGVAVQEGIEHLQAVHPQVFSNEPDDEEYDLDNATGPVLDNSDVPTREEKIKAIRDYLRKAGFTDGGMV